MIHPLIMSLVYLFLLGTPLLFSVEENTSLLLKNQTQVDDSEAMHTLPDPHIATFESQLKAGETCHRSYQHLNGLYGKRQSIKKKSNKNRGFSFAVMGDTAYYMQDEERLIRLIHHVLNKEELAFVVHVGDQQNDPSGTDIGLSSTPSTPIALTAAQFIPKRHILWQIRHPFIITPGDNDWADTIREPDGPLIGQAPFPPNPDPIATLESFRDVYYRQGTNVKFPFKMVSQSKEQPQYSEFIENKRWIYQGIVFLTLHTISLNNGLEPGPSPFPSAVQAVIDESVGNGSFQGRINAGEAWLTEAFNVADAIDAKGIVIFTHVPTSGTSMRGVYDFRTPTGGYEGLMTIMRNRTLECLPKKRQVLVCFGDGHFFTISKPLPVGGTYPPTDTTAQDLNLLPNFTAIETPGSSFTRITGAQGRVKIEVDFKKPSLFSIYSSVNTL